MKNEKTQWVILIMAILAQYVFMRTADIFEQQLPFITGLIRADTIGGNIVAIMYTISTVPFILLIFSHDVYRLLSGYGNLLVIRSYSKSKLLVRLIVRSCGKLLIIMCIYLFIFEIFPDDRWCRLEFIAGIKVLISYYLMLSDLVLLMYVAELIISPQVSYILTVIYFTSSLLIYTGSDSDYSVRSMLMFPNLGYGLRNGALALQSSVQYTHTVFSLFVLGIILIIISLHRIKKIDYMEIY